MSDDMIGSNRTVNQPGLVVFRQMFSDSGLVLLGRCLHSVNRTIWKEQIGIWPARARFAFRAESPEIEPPKTIRKAKPSVVLCQSLHVFGAYVFQLIGDPP